MSGALQQIRPRQRREHISGQLFLLDEHRCAFGNQNDSPTPKRESARKYIYDRLET
jgi:hypothetical protein